MQNADDVQRMLSVLREYTIFGHWFPADLARMTVEMLEGLLKERDAAVNSLKDDRICQECKHRDVGWKEPCMHCDYSDNHFEWRGVQKEG